MQPPQTRHVLYLLIALLGLYAQIAQALLAREALVVFYGNELSLGAFYGGWLWWLALGSLLAVRWRARPWVVRPMPPLRMLVLALPLLLLGQMLLLRGVRLLLDVSPSEFILLSSEVRLVQKPTKSAVDGCVGTTLSQAGRCSFPPLKIDVLFPSPRRLCLNK